MTAGKREPRAITLAEIEQQFELASYWFGGKWCPAVHLKGWGYGIRVIRSHSFSGANESVTYGYFEVSRDGMITTAPRGWAKVYKPGRVVDIEAAAARYEAPQADPVTAPTPNAALAYAVLDHIDAHPKQWDQGHWYGANPECGTTACFAGWAVALSGHLVTLNEPDVDGFQSWAAIDGDENAAVRDVAVEELGIADLTMPCHLCDTDCDEVNPASGALFGGSNTREDLGRLVAEIFGPRPEATS